HGGVGWNLRAALRGHELHRADEAGGIARREQLLGIVAGATASAELLRGCKLDAERAIEGLGLAVAAAGCLSAGLVEHVHGHGVSPGCGFDASYIANNSIVHNITQ